MNLEKSVKINALFDCYESLLTPKQRLLVSEYYCFDRSLSEIAENQNISRQAVQEAIAKAVKKLEEYEAKLHLNQIKQQVLFLEEKFSDAPELQPLLKILNGE